MIKYTDEDIAFMIIHGDGIKKSIIKDFKDGKVKGSNQLEQMMLYFSCDYYKFLVSEKKLKEKNGERCKRIPKGTKR